MKKNLKFDISNSSTTNPVDSLEIYHAALIKGGSKELFSKILDVKDKARIKKHTFGNVLQSDSCTFSDQGAGTLSEKLVDACSIKVNIEMCQSTLESSFVSHTMSAGQLNTDFLPVDFQNYLVTKLAEKMAADFEVLVWQGEAGSTSASYPAPLCDGLLAQFTADGTVIDVAGASGGVNSTNVIAELTKVYDDIPEAIKFSPDLRIFVSTNILSAYKVAVANASNEAYFTKDAVPTFLGIPLVLSQGLPANEMVAARIS